MDYGVLIDNHLELIKFDYDYNIYISRKALKHFVESRKKEMFETHTEQEIFDKLYFAIDNIINTYMDYDKFEIEKSGRLIYIKYFTELRNSNLRIVFEEVLNHLEICSIHFQKYKKPP
jgi:glutaredoxin-related protein